MSGGGLRGERGSSLRARAAGGRELRGERGSLLRAGDGAGAASGRELRGERGQSIVELVGLLPLLVVVGLAVAQVLMAGAAREFAGHAAEAGAVALLQGGDAEDAVRRAVPGWSRSSLGVDVQGGAVHVTVEPASLVPPLARLLTASAVARSGS